MEKMKTSPLWVDWLIAKQLGDAVRKDVILTDKVFSITNEYTSAKTIAWGKSDDSDRVMTYLNKHTNGVTSIRIVAQKWKTPSWRDSIVINASLNPINKTPLVEVVMGEEVRIYRFRSILLGYRIKRLLGVLLTHPEFQVKEVK